MMLRSALAALTLCLFSCVATAQPLRIDFNSTTQDGGPHNQAGYSAYDAGHEVIMDFVTMSYSAFGTMVDVTPAWPDSTDNRVQQMIDRGSGNDANWEGTQLDLVTDFIGIDTRTGNGGNGNYDGMTGDPTRMTLTLSGIPAGTYDLRSFHHDTENIHTSFLFDASVDGGATLTRVGEFKMTNSSAGSNPPEPEVFTGTGGQDPADLPSTIDLRFTSDGSDVVLQYTPLSADAVHTQIFGMNGLEISRVPEPSSAVLGLCALLGLLGMTRRRR